MTDQELGDAIAGLCFELRQLAETLHVAANAIERTPDQWDAAMLSESARLLGRAAQAIERARMDSPRPARGFPQGDDSWVS